MTVARLSLLFVGVLTAPGLSLAQESKSVSRASLLAQDSVQEELELTQGQRTRIGTVLGPRDDTPEARAEIEKELSEALRPEQRTRLDELRVQVLVSRGALSDELRTKLRVTEDQAGLLDKAEGVNEAAFQKLLDSLKRVRFRSEKARLDFIETEFRKPAVERLAAALTAEQRKALDKLQGDPFRTAAVIAASR